MKLREGREGGGRKKKGRGERQRQREGRAEERGGKGKERRMRERQTDRQSMRAYGLYHLSGNGVSGVDCHT